MLIDAARGSPRSLHSATATVAFPTWGFLYSSVRPLWLVEVTLKGRAEPVRFVGIATVCAVAYSIALPMLGLYILIMAPVERDRAPYAVAVAACYVPLQAWLVYLAARATPVRGHGWALAVLAGLTVGMVPVIGVRWMNSAYVLAALVLLMIRAPWGTVLFAALAAAPAPAAIAFGAPEWALYYAIGLPMAAVPLAVVVGLIRAARHLQDARLTLAQEAVVRERLRIDEELRETVGDALEAIAVRGDRAAALVAGDPPATEPELRALVGAARRTLADARRLVTRYQDVSLQSELQTAMTLLSAAGIQVRVALPLDELPDTIDRSARDALRRDVARLLGEQTDHVCRTAAVVARDGLLRLELSSDSTGSGVAMEPSR